MRQQQLAEASALTRAVELGEWVKLSFWLNGFLSPRP